MGVLDKKRVGAAVSRTIQRNKVISINVAKSVAGTAVNDKIVNTLVSLFPAEIEEKLRGTAMYTLLYIAVANGFAIALELAKEQVDKDEYKKYLDAGADACVYAASNQVLEAINLPKMFSDFFGPQVGRLIGQIADGKVEMSQAELDEITDGIDIEELERLTAPGQ